MIESMWEILKTYHDGFLDGLFVTLKLCGIVWVLGIVLGSLLGLAATAWKRLAGWPLKIVTIFITSVPIIVILLWLHFPMQAIIQHFIDPFWTSTMALSLVNIFAVGHLVRQVLEDFPEHLADVARTYGVSGGRILLKIKMPILIRQALPSVILQQMIMLHASLFASLISVDEIFRVAQRVNALEYKPVEIYTILGLFFVVVCVPINLFTEYLRRRFSYVARER